MSLFIAKRALSCLITIFIIITASFFTVRLAPGSPFSSERDIPPEVLNNLKAKYGLDQPIEKQFVHYLENLLQGDLGLSTKYPRSVNEIIAISLPKTLQLGTIAVLWALLIGISAGVFAAIRQNTAWDYSFMAIAMIGISVPSFVLGPILILVFSLYLYWFPPGGWGSFEHMILPGITLGTVYAAYIARLTRAGMLEIIRTDFVRTAKAKGLKESYIIWKHVMKGGLIPTITYLGPAIASMMTGSVVVEKIFNTPGIGPYFVDAAFNRDYFLIMGIVIVYSTFLLGMNFLVDLLYGYLDPRIRYD
ncbi:MAG: ABC transporter permease subunit [Bdellovibrionales bacterium]|nr:ABC transporter permease subunit [Bdellovibrionales bacterium]